MRVTQSETYRNFVFDLDTLNTILNRLARQVSSGSRLTQLSDSPGGSAELLSLTDLEADIDQYRSSSNTITYFLNVADSALNEVNNLIASIYARGSQASSETIRDDGRAAIAADIRSMRDQIVSLANSQAKGRYIFAGSAVSAAPFEIAGDSVSYKGDTDISSIELDGGMQVRPGVSGSEAFNPVFAAIESLLSAIDSNDVTAVTSALGQFESALSSVGVARGKIGTSLNALRNLDSRLDVQYTQLEERRSRIEDVDMVEAVVQVNQAKSALETAMSAGGSILSQRNLFDVLG